MEGDFPADFGCERRPFASLFNASVTLGLLIGHPAIPEGHPQLHIQLIIFASVLLPSRPRSPRMGFSTDRVKDTPGAGHRGADRGLPRVLTLFSHQIHHPLSRIQDHHPMAKQGELFPHGSHIEGSNCTWLDKKLIRTRFLGTVSIWGSR